MDIKDILYDFAEEEGIEIVEMKVDEDSPTHYCFHIKGNNGVYEGHALCLEDEDLFMFYILPGIIVPEDKLLDTSWQLLQRNYGLKLAKWYIEPDSHVLTVRGEQFLDGADWEMSRRIMEVIAACASVVDADYPVLVRHLVAE